VLNGTVMIQLLNMVLDFLDALAGAVTIAYWWCTWVRPAKQPERSPRSGPAEIDRFLCKAQARTQSTILPVTSDQGVRRSNVTRPA
jgi:hypothetical protein